MCNSPLLAIPKKLAQNINITTELDKILASIIPGWRGTEDDSSGPIALEDLRLSQNLLIEYGASESMKERLREAHADASSLIDLRQDLGKEQHGLKASFTEEVARIEKENEQTERRRNDFTPMVYSALQKLAERGVLKDILQEAREG